MAEGHDIGAELYEQIRAEFERLLAERNTSLPADDRRVSMVLGNKYAKTVGECLAQAIGKYITPETLPNGKLYYNIAEKILDPTLRENHRLVNDYCTEIQERLNDRQNIHITPQRAKYPEDRAHSLINAASHAEEWQETERILDDSVRAFTDKCYADNVKANADLRSKAGLRVEIVREGGSDCCPWCADLSGRYLYPSEVPKDVYRRHDNCTCSVTYVNGRDRQNVWTKAQWTAPEAAARRETARSYEKPRVISKEEAQALRERVGGLTFGRYSDILSLSDSSSIYKFVGEKAVNDVPLMQIFGERIETDPIKRANDQILNVLHKRASEDLLSFIRADEQACLANDPNYEPGVEYSIVFDENMQPIKGREKPQKYEQGRCNIESPGAPFHAFHNHGSSETLGITDISGFSVNDDMRSITAQGNNGKSKFTLYKTYNYDKAGYNDYISEMQSQTFYTIGEKRITLRDCADQKKKEEINNLYNSLSDSEKASFKKALLEKTKECLKGGEKYGVKYISSKA